MLANVNNSTIIDYTAAKYYFLIVASSFNKINNKKNVREWTTKNRFQFDYNLFQIKSQYSKTGYFIMIIK